MRNRFLRLYHLEKSSSFFNLEIINDKKRSMIALLLESSEVMVIYFKKAKLLGRQLLIHFKKLKQEEVDDVK